MTRRGRRRPSKVKPGTMDPGIPQMPMPENPGGTPPGVSYKSRKVEAVDAGPGLEPLAHPEPLNPERAALHQQAEEATAAEHAESNRLAQAAMRTAIGAAEQEIQEEQDQMQASEEFQEAFGSTSEPATTTSAPNPSMPVTSTIIPPSVPPSDNSRPDSSTLLNAVGTKPTGLTDQEWLMIQKERYESKQSDEMTAAIIAEENRQAQEAFLNSEQINQTAIPQNAASAGYQAPPASDSPQPQSPAVAYVESFLSNNPEHPPLSQECTRALERLDRQNPIQQLRILFMLCGIKWSTMPNYMQKLLQLGAGHASQEVTPQFILTLSHLFPTWGEKKLWEVATLLSGTSACCFVFPLVYTAKMMGAQEDDEIYQIALAGAAKQWGIQLEDDPEDYPTGDMN